MWMFDTPSFTSSAISSTSFFGDRNRIVGP